MKEWKLLKQDISKSELFAIDVKISFKSSCKSFLPEDGNFYNMLNGMV